MLVTAIWNGTKIKKKGDKNMDEGIFLDMIPVLGEKDCGTGHYTLYVQYWHKDNYYYMMFKSDDKEKLELMAEQCNYLRNERHQRRKNPDLEEAFVI